MAVVLLALGLLAAGVGASELLRFRDRVHAATDRPAPVAAPARAPLLPETVSTTVPTAAGIDAVLAAGFSEPAAGPVAASVLDVATGNVLLDRRASASLLPASTAKLATAVAALTALPPDRRLVTRVLAGPAPGLIVLVGGGDVTLASDRTPVGYPPVARLAELATQVRTRLAGQPLTGVLVDDTLYAGPPTGPGWRPSYVASGNVAPVSALALDEGRVAPDRNSRVADPAIAAGRALAAGLGAASVPVQRGTAASGATELAAESSPPVPELVQLMLQRSDNDIAESLARQVAIADSQPASFDGVAAALARTLSRTLPAQAAGIALVDGSGLSRLDRAQPAALAGLLSLVAGGSRPLLAPLLAGLPVAGFDGSLDDRFVGPALPAAGEVRAKTGTLEGTSALAGLVRTQSGRLLAFDLTADAVPAGAAKAEPVLDRLAAALASCGCP